MFRECMCAIPSSSCFIMTRDCSSVYDPRSSISEKRSWPRKSSVTMHSLLLLSKCSRYCSTFGCDSRCSSRISSRANLRSVSFVIILHAHSLPSTRSTATCTTPQEPSPKTPPSLYFFLNDGVSEPPPTSFFNKCFMLLLLLWATRWRYGAPRFFVALTTRVLYLAQVRAICHPGAGLLGMSDAGGAAYAWQQATARKATPPSAAVQSVVRWDTYVPALAVARSASVLVPYGTDRTANMLMFHRLRKFLLVSGVAVTAGRGCGRLPIFTC
mmetsp:Transcript_35459/g.90759  ORF Transcript_35459/g.90759 Transcript_35459/m.90759 type:complete len:270 (-) Transcript_35459:89-898(-)